MAAACLRCAAVCRVLIDGEGTVTISDVRREDAGSYVCVAWNVAGERHSAPALLTVRGTSCRPQRDVSDVTGAFGAGGGQNQRKFAPPLPEVSPATESGHLGLTPTVQLSVKYRRFVATG